MGQWYMGRSSTFFASPKEFRPERWLADDGDEASRAAIEDTLRPFSLGPRNCLGKLLALAEAKLVVAKLLWHFDMELDGPHERWVEDARFYVSLAFSFVSESRILMEMLTRGFVCVDPVAAPAADREVDSRPEGLTSIHHCPPPTPTMANIVP